MKYKVAFVCTGNSCRSQIAEGWAKQLGSEVLEAYSAGTEPVKKVNPNAVLVMNEAGVDISSFRPKLLSELPKEIDILVTMGCGVVCPYLPHKYKVDWGLDDPVGQPIEVFRETRDLIKEKLLKLINNIQKFDIINED